MFNFLNITGYTGSRSEYLKSGHKANVLKVKRLEMSNSLTFLFHSCLYLVFLFILPMSCGHLVAVSQMLTPVNVIT